MPTTVDRAAGALREWVEQYGSKLLPEHMDPGDVVDEAKSLRDQLEAELFRLRAEIEGVAMVLSHPIEEQASFLEEWALRIEDESVRVSDDLRRRFHENANIVGCTCSYAGSISFRQDFGKFDWVVIDEVSKATPLDLLMPALLGKRIILVGDHKQLPPFIGTELSYVDAGAALGETQDSLRTPIAA